jgi:signal transduction histidine kinase
MTSPLLERTAQWSVRDASGTSVAHSGSYADREAVVAFDADGRVRAANALAWSMLDIESATIRDLLGPLVEGTDPSPPGGATTVDSTELQLRSMPDRWFELTLIQGSDPRNARIAIFRDVTVARRDAAIGELLPTLLSHELRTPMTGVYAAAELLRAGATDPLGERRMALVQDLSAEVRRLKLLIDDLTVLCRDDDDLGISVQPELMHRLLPDIMSRQHRDSQEQDIEFHVEAEPGITNVDRHALEQVMSDLIANAAHRAADGRISITLGTHPQGGALVSVLDGGPGYRDRERRLLRPIGFVHLTGEADSAAISLHVAYRLVTAMGGRIWARNRTSGGEVGFWLRPFEETGHSGSRQGATDMTRTGVRHVQ